MSDMPFVPGSGYAGRDANLRRNFRQGLKRISEINEAEDGKDNLVKTKEKVSGRVSLQTLTEGDDENFVHIIKVKENINGQKGLLPLTEEGHVFKSGIPKKGKEEPITDFETLDGGTYGREVPVSCRAFGNKGGQRTVAFVRKGKSNSKVLMLMPLDEVVFMKDGVIGIVDVTEENVKNEEKEVFVFEGEERVTTRDSRLLRVINGLEGLEKGTVTTENKKRNQTYLPYLEDGVGYRLEDFRRRN